MVVTFDFDDTLLYRSIEFDENGTESFTLAEVLRICMTDGKAEK